MKSRLLAVVAGASIAFIFPSIAPAAPDDWAEGSAGHNDGATRKFYNAGAQLLWRNPEGDWRDADGVPQGPKPFAVAAIDKTEQPGLVEWDATAVAREWASGKSRHKGLLLRNTKGGGSYIFHSREATEPAHRPRLLIVVDGHTQTLDAVADTYLDRSTYRALGNSTSLKVDGSLPALVRFDFSSIKPADKIDRATLKLTASQIQSAGEVGLYLCDQGEKIEPMEPISGIAANYPGDEGIEKDADVLFATGFEADDWKKQWSSVGGKVETITADPNNKFEPLTGKACRAFLGKGELTAMNQTYQFRRQNGSEPEEVYFRYYLRLGDDWRPTLEGGKMPGISGTYGRAGWGGRKVDGRNGWSARGAFRTTLPEGNPLSGKQPLGFYCYHADMPGTYGDIWLWTKGYRGFLDNNRWYCIEQYVKLNTPGKDGSPGTHDGILRVWVDGRPAFEKTDLRFRDVNTLKVEQIWMNVYHGGTRPSPTDQHLYVDNVVVARKYIGPKK